MKQRSIEIMDTTLRDGEQTSGVSFSATEKLTLAQLLLTEVKVDRIEIASARVSEGEFQAVKRITDWAKENGHLHKIEVLTFVDGDTSINWLEKAGAKVMNILTKGSLNHLTHQLKKTPDEHFKDIAAVIKKAQKKGIESNVYLEDWSNGMRNSKEYVFRYLDFIAKQPIKRVLLPDTLGILIPSETYAYIAEITERYPQLHFDFHGHNDYDLGVANALEAVKAGARGLHLTINGMGERAGNTPLASIVAVLNDFQKDVKTNVNEKALYKISKLVEAFSGFRVSPNKPVVGENVFTQTAGIHADGDKKKNLYYNDLMPERFGRKRKYALGKTSGKANIENNLQQLGIQLPDEDLKKVTQRIIELGDKKETVTQDDLPFIISDVLDSNTTTEKVYVEDYVLTHSKNMRPSTTVRIRFEDGVVEENAQGDGQYDAFMNALRKIYTQKKLPLAKLSDYIVRIPPGGKSDALCETIITWNLNGREFTTTGLDSDQTVAAIKATQKMLNLV
ncbi:2-isopropylmalate synthase [Niabella sp. CC-SYL272]|uniref:alpha-isopropylmalate synthase regulatory domain-containing protein n=1 Tax=Niabella agricola TaxID=2891571 RepID=UPI001F30E58E|nr:alpha-isopropylmalate synthase regulatory domain-containing protein [Niabella agricola]MCF3108902.1 2-isopropylmalate synthase [Niabella agricola]